MTTEPSTEPLLDEALFAELFGDGDAEFVSEIVDLFLADAPQRIADVIAAVDRGEARALNRAAHSLKGSSQCIGAMRLGRLGETIEHLAADGDLAAASRLVSGLAHELKLISHELEQRLAAMTTEVSRA
jgi:HPt (histidine-containing phosphotransfer) domain-containing protein